MAGNYDKYGNYDFSMFEPKPVSFDHNAARKIATLTNISVIDQKIEEQKKQNELERLKTEQALIASKGLTKEILYKQFIDKWDGKTPLYGVTPEFLKITN